jgi:hypothetical protein
MARNIIVVMICGVVVFALVWKVAPDFLATALAIPGSTETIVEETAKAEEPVKPNTNPKGSKSRAPKGHVVVAAVTLPGIAPAEQQEAIEPATISQPAYPTYARRRPHVSTDSATLYSSNAPTGRVVRVLKKDEILELHFKVNNGGQEWMYVNVPNQQVSGFLSSDTLVE